MGKLRLSQFTLTILAVGSTFNHCCWRLFRMQHPTSFWSRQFRWFIRSNKYYMVSLILRILKMVENSFPIFIFHFYVWSRWSKWLSCPHAFLSLYLSSLHMWCCELFTVSIPRPTQSLFMGDKSQPNRSGERLLYCLAFTKNTAACTEVFSSILLNVGLISAGLSDQQNINRVWKWIEKPHRRSVMAADISQTFLYNWNYFLFLM